MTEDSVDLIVTSIPFANHYEYTPTYNDFGQLLEYIDEDESVWRWVRVVRTSST